MDIKWNMALLSMRADKFWKRTGKKISIQGSDVAGWDWSYMANEEDHALVADGKTPTKFALMANIKNKVETLKEEKDVVDGKLARLLKSLKDLENIIESQRSEKIKEGVGYNVVPSPTADLKGPEFVLHKKPCFNCGDFSHLANDCRRRVQRETNRSKNHSYKSSTRRSAGHRPNGAHMRPPLRYSGPRPHGDFMRPSFRPAGHRPHGPSMNPRRPTMNVKNQYRAPWVPTVNWSDPPVNRKFSIGRRNFPTANRKFSTASRKFTTGSRKYHTADMGRKGKAVKPSAC
nr:hypothetical protein [Tanacetum cinerariifolium]